MTFFDWFINPIKNHYFDFEGRADRQTFWMYILVYVIVYFAIAIGSSIAQVGHIVMPLFVIGVLLPTLGITARRLHDTGKSGWWQLVGIVPFFGAIVLIVLCALEGEKVANEYGPVVAGQDAVNANATVVTEATSETNPDTPNETLVTEVTSDTDSDTPKAG